LLKDLKLRSVPCVIQLFSVCLGPHRLRLSGS